MELHKIDSIQELRQERLRLQQEADVARELLHFKVQGAIESSKKGLLGSWKAIIPVVLAAGIQQFTSNNSSRIPRGTRGENEFFATFQEGFHAFQRPGNERWIALFPIIIRLWELWQDRQDERSELVPSPVNQESIIRKESALRSEEPVLC